MSMKFPLQTLLVDLVMLAILAGLAVILSIAMVLQYASGEIPCPLCLLQRVAMFGVCFAIIHHFRNGYDGRNIGVALMWALFLLVVSIRQVLINIVARPGHAYPGSAVFGLHMPVWSVVIAFAVLLVLAATLATFDGTKVRASYATPPMTWIANFTAAYVIVLALINLVSAVLQCGIGACHTTGYSLLSYR